MTKSNPELAIPKIPNIPFTIVAIIIPNSPTTNNVPILVKSFFVTYP